jgi:hypothetical protein
MWVGQNRPRGIRVSGRVTGRTTIPMTPSLGHRYSAFSETPHKPQINLIYGRYVMIDPAGKAILELSASPWNLNMARGAQYTAGSATCFNYRAFHDASSGWGTSTVELDLNKYRPRHSAIVLSPSSFTLLPYHISTMLKHSENKLNSSPPSPSLTAVEPSHPTPEDKPAKLGVQPISSATGGVPRTTSPINPASIAYPSSNAKPPEQAEKYEHEQLENSNPGLFQALEEAGVYFAYRDAEGSDIIRSTKEDKRNPRNYPKWKRYLIVGLASWLNNLVCLCVSGYSTGAGQIAEEFNVSAEVVTVGLSLYVVSRTSADGTSIQCLIRTSFCAVFSSVLLSVIRSPNYLLRA